MKLDKKILIGLDALLKNDAYLLSVDTNERSITHKLAECYQDFFPEWNVDCEYNKNLLAPKEIVIDPIDFLAKMASFIKRHYKDDSLRVLLREKIDIQDMLGLLKDLKNRENLLYDEELDLIYFVLNENGGEKIVKTIFPDIIIHHRGTKDNHIVIEAKKTSNKNKKARLFDIVKLMTLVTSSGYHYKNGIFINIPTGLDLSRHKGFKIAQSSFNSKVFQIF